jgi:hypothetical protein
MPARASICASPRSLVYHVATFGDRGDRCGTRDEHRDDAQPLRDDHEAVRLASAEREPGHEIHDRDGEAQPDGDECEMRTEGEAQTAPAGIPSRTTDATCSEDGGPSVGSGSQQPGSPSWPQQVWRRTTRSQRFRPATANRWQRDVRIKKFWSARDAVLMAMRVHLPTIAGMPDDAKKIKTGDAELTLEQIAELLPGTGELMQSVGNAGWKCACRTRGELGAGRVLRAPRPRSAAEARDRSAEIRGRHRGVRDGTARQCSPRASAGTLAGFERSFADAVDRANALHGSGEVLHPLGLPPDPPEDLELT